MRVRIQGCGKVVQSGFEGFSGPGGTNSTEPPNRCEQYGHKASYCAPCKCSARGVIAIFRLQFGFGQVTIASILFPFRDWSVVTPREYGNQLAVLSSFPCDLKPRQTHHVSAAKAYRTSGGPIINPTSLLQCSR